MISFISCRPQQAVNSAQRTPSIFNKQQTSSIIIIKYAIYNVNYTIGYTQRHPFARAMSILAHGMAGFLSSIAFIIVPLAEQLMA
jgi:hypothetical protein